MRRRAATAVVGVLLALQAWAAPPPPATPEGLLSFARALLTAGESYRAVTEYLRFLHFYGESPEAPEALEGLGRAYAQADRWNEAVEAFRRLADVRPDEESRHLLGAALYRAQRYADAARVLLAGSPPSEDAVLGTLALLRSGQTGSLFPGARDDLAREYADLDRKSPAVAGFLSAVLPGAGHLYTGRPRDATVAFVLNGAFLWGTYEAAHREEWALAGILGAFEAGWYAGSVVSSMNAAHKWNRREEGRFFQKWEEGRMPQWGVVIGPATLGGGLTWRW